MPGMRKMRRLYRATVKAYLDLDQLTHLPETGCSLPSGPSANLYNGRSDVRLQDYICACRTPSDRATAQHTCRLCLANNPLIDWKRLPSTAAIAHSGDAIRSALDITAIAYARGPASTKPHGITAVTPPSTRTPANGSVQDDLAIQTPPPSQHAPHPVQLTPSIPPSFSCSKPSSDPGAG